jgi:hypothetical protein
VLVRGWWWWVVWCTYIPPHSRILEPPGTRVASVRRVWPGMNGCSPTFCTQIGLKYHMRYRLSSFLGFSYHYSSRFVDQDRTRIVSAQDQNRPQCVSIDLDRALSNYRLALLLTMLGVVNNTCGLSPVETLTHGSHLYGAWSNVALTSRDTRH